jgi:putative ABC transport system permease protein
MISNFIKVIFRYLFRSRFFAILNIAGLSIGMACSIVIYLFVRNELSYDKFHTDGNNLYRVIRQSQINGMPYNIGVTSWNFGEALPQDYGDRISATTRTLSFNGLVKFEDKSFLEEKLFLVDKNFFQFFSYPLEKGQPSQVLQNPNDLVISKAFARKYFGETDPIGKTLRIDDTYDVQVTGILDEVPGNTHLQFDVVGSIALIENQEWVKNWWANAFNTYVKVGSQAHVDFLNKAFPDFMNKHFGKDFERVGNKIGLKLEPLHDIYFNYDTRYETNVAHGDERYIFVFSSIGVLLILLAGINYVNLATAQASKRAKEVGIRKTLGSSKTAVATQFLSESFFLCLLSMFVGVGLAQIGIPFFNSSFGLSIPGIWSDPFLWIFLALLLVVISITSGAYPSFLLSSFKPIKVLKGEVKGNLQYLFIRKALVVFQFTISVLMIISTLFIGEQLRFMREKDLGFDAKHLVVVRMNNELINNQRKTFKDRLLAEQIFESASYSSGQPGGFYDATTVNIQGEEENMRMRTLWADEDFLKTMDLQVATGRFFSDDYSSDSTSAVLLNETAVKQLGWTNDAAIGRRVILSQFDSVYKEVIGVVKDYHFTSLKEKIEPLIISHTNGTGHLLLKVSGTQIDGSVAALEEIWNSYNTGFPLEFSFVDDVIGRLYAAERVQGKIFTTFSLISVAIACLGILGLATYIAAQRRKEIGIRKVLGASAGEVSLLLMKDLLKLVLAAIVVAIPLGYYAIEMWSQGFAYRAPLSPTVFVIGASAVFITAMLIVGLNASRVAMQDPTKSLRTE